MMLILLLFSFHLLVGTGSGSEAHVVELTDSNFDAFTREKCAIVQFYTNWCIHCANLAPIYAATAKELAPLGVRLGRVDVEAAKLVQEKYAINEFPYVAIFREGQIFAYEGPGERAGVSGLVQYFTKECNRSIGVQDNVISLSSANLQVIIGQSDLVVVNFYAPWCAYCKKLEPVYEMVARQLKALAPNTILAQVDATMETELATKYAIDTYPKLIMFRKGRRHDYLGPGTVDGMLNYLLAQSRPASSELANQNQYSSFVSSANVRAVAFLAQSDQSFLSLLLEAADLIRNDVEVAHCYTVQFAEATSVVYGSVVVYHPKHLVTPYESGFTVITMATQFNSSILANEMLKASRPLVGQLNEANRHRAYLVRPLLIAYYQVDWKETPAATRYWHHMIAQVAKEFQEEQLSCAIADEHQFRSDLVEFGLDDWGEDVAIGIYAGGPHKYRMEEEEVTIETLRHFVRDFLAKSLKPYIKSEPVSRSNLHSKSLIKTIVGSNFERAVFDPRLNGVVLYMCYSEPQACKDTWPLFTTVAKGYRGRLTFMEMDVSKNDPPLSIDINSLELPTVYMVAAGSNGAVRMEQDFTTKQDLINFIETTITRNKDEL